MPPNPLHLFAAHAAAAAADGRARGAQEQGEEGRTVQEGQLQTCYWNLFVYRFCTILETFDVED